MQLAAPRQAGPLDLGIVVLLHLAALAALLLARIEPVPISATAPIMAQIIQAPVAAPAAPAPRSQPAPPLAMRTQPRKPAPPPQAAPRRKEARQLTTTTTRAGHEVEAAAPKPVPAPPPRQTPRVAPPPPPSPAPAPPERAAEPLAPLPAAAQSVTSAPAVAAAAATAPTAAPERAAGSMGAPSDNRAYFAALLQRLNRFKVYPAPLRKAKIEGRVVLKFTIDAQGRVTGSSVQRTSGHTALDDAAERMLARASPLPAIPSSMGKTSLTMSVPIEYSLLTDR